MVNAIPQKAKIDQGWLHKRCLKILLLSWEYPPNVVGGLSRHVYGLATRLARQGHEIHVLTAGDREWPNYEWKEAVHVHRVRPVNEHDDQFLAWIGGLNVAMALKGELLASEIPFDIIHAHDWLVGSAAMALKEVLSIPLLTTIHATEHGRNQGIHTEMQNFIHEREVQLISASDHLIVCSEYMKESLMTLFQVEEKKLTVIPNGIHLSMIKTSAAKVFPELTRREYIFSIGRIVREKGFETIIKAAEIAKAMNHDYFFVIAGEGPMLEIYRKQIMERNLAQYVAFIGYVTEEEKFSLIQNCEMMVIPSLYEPFGIVALEALAQEKPVIVSNIGGMKGIITHLQTGMIMNPDDPFSLLEQIEFLRKHRQLAKNIALKGHEVVRSLYDWGQIASDTSRVMKQMTIGDTGELNRCNIN